MRTPHQKDEIKNLAENLFSTGKLIRDRIYEIQTSCLKQKGHRERFAALTLPQLEVVKLVHQNAPISLIELADLLNVSPPSASQMVDRLVDKGILTRENAEEDRRRVNIQVAPAAVNDIREVEDAVLDSFVSLIKSVGPDTGKQWCDVFNQVNGILEGDIRHESLNAS